MEKQTWYEVGMSDGIRPVVVVKETDKTITIESETFDGRIKTRRTNKSGHFYRHFRTYQEAVNSIRREKESAVQHARENVAYADRELREFNEKYPPKTP